MDSHDKKELDARKLSIYDLPALNAVIDQYEPPNAKGAELRSRNSEQQPPSGKA